MSNNTSQLRAGAALSYVNLFLSSLIPFFYTPVMLRILGQSEYGLYSLSASVIGYLSLLSFGFGSAIVRYISIYRTKGEKQKEQNIFGFFLLIYLVMAAVVMMCGIFISLHVEQIFHKGLTDPELNKMRVLTMIMAFNTALSFPISVFSSVIMAHERYIFRRILDMFLTIIAPLSNLAALFLGFASVGMAASSTIVQLVLLPINFLYCSRKLNVRPRFSIIPRELIREIIGFSFFIFIGTIVDILFWSTDKVILGMLTSTTVVAIYNIGGTFNGIVTSLSTSISSVLTPRVTSMVVMESEQEKFSELFIRVGRLQFLIVGLVVSGFTVFGRSFLTLWVGQDYLESYWIAILTMFPLCVPLIQNTGISIVVAQNKHQFRSIVYLIIAIINAITTYFVVPIYGALGAAACSGIAYIIGQGIIMNLYYYTVTGIDIPQFWKNIIIMAIIPGLMTVSGLLILTWMVLDSWISFFAGVVMYTLLYGLLMYCFMINEWEKSIIFDFLKKLKGLNKHY